MTFLHDFVFSSPLADDVAKSNLLCNDKNMIPVALRCLPNFLTREKLVQLSKQHFVNEAV